MLTSVRLAGCVVAPLVLAACGGGAGDSDRPILVSAAASEEDRALLRALGIRHFVAKDEGLRRNLQGELRLLFGSVTDALSPE